MIDGETLFRHAIASPDVMAKLRKSFATLDKHRIAGRYDRYEAMHLLSRNTRDAAASYTRAHAPGALATDVAPYETRAKCASLFIEYWRGTLTVTE